MGTDSLDKRHTHHSGVLSMQPSRDGDDRVNTIQEYLREAERCELYASRAAPGDRQVWLDLADRWRALAATFRK